MTLIEYLTDVGEHRAPSDNEDYNPYEYTGSNVDDAFESGCLDGEINFARNLLEKIQSGEFRVFSLPTQSEV